MKYKVKTKTNQKVRLLGHDFNVSLGVDQSLPKDMIFFSFNKESNNLFLVFIIGFTYTNFWIIVSTTKIGYFYKA